ncbi:MAG: ribulose-phosphate 3-epimerase [Simkaniaceae bacterium]|nr:ribulose-phosphate 3-epimerase [Simkaniaceae bacterium]
MKIQVAPSIFAFDLGQLADEAKRIESAGADAIHYDMMDGHFVPNLSLSTLSLAAVNRSTDLFMDVHIMVYNPFDYIEDLVKSGADRITFHIEATEDVKETIEFIRRCNVQVGLAICPETSAELLVQYLDDIDLVLAMTVHPGFSGQAFIPEVLEKIKMLRHINKKVHIQVDGGIDDKTAPLCVEAGADILVAGSHLSKAKDLEAKIKQLRKR